MIGKLKNKAFNITILTVLITVTMQFSFIRYASYGIDKTDYGNFVLLQTVIAGLSAVLLQIPGQAFDRFYNHCKDKSEFVNEFKTILIGINGISLILITVYGTVYKRFSLEILLLLFLYFVLLNNYTLNQKVFLLNMQRNKYFYLQILESSSKFLFPIIFYFFFHTLASILYGIVIGYTVSYIVLQRYLKTYRFKFILHWEKLRHYFLFAYPIVFVSLFTWGISFSDRYFIDYFLSTEDVAVYSLLAMVAGVGQIVGQVYFMYAEPKILKHYAKNRDQTHRMINAYIFKLIIVFVFLSIIAMVLPKFFYTILIEKNIIFTPYYFHTMMILLVAMFVNILHVAYHMHLKLLNRLDILAYIFFAALIINLTGNLFIPTYGIIAAALATLLAYLVIFVLQIFAVSRLKTEKRYV